MHDTTGIVLATDNAGKLAEIKKLLAPLNWTVHDQKTLGVIPVEETGLTFIENALLKARAASVQTGLPAIADDSGLEVPALKGKPGIYSSRYAGDAASDQDNLEKLLADMTHFSQDSQRQARFVCAMVFMSYAEDPTPVCAMGLWQGHIRKKPSGDQGFGYDPVFQPGNQLCTAAELPRSVKNKYSHRAQAMHAMLTEIKTSKLSS